MFFFFFLWGGGLNYCGISLERLILNLQKQIF